MIRVELRGILFTRPLRWLSIAEEGRQNHSWEAFQTRRHVLGCRWRSENPGTPKRPAQQPIWQP